MKSNKLENEQLYDSFFLSQTFDSEQLTLSAQKEVEWLIQKNKLIAGSEVIDIGCGSGRHIRAFLDKDLNCTGIDLSQSCIELAKKNCPEIQSQLFEIDFLNYEKENVKKFDLVFVSGATIGYSDTEEMNTIYLQSLANTVKKSGFWVFDFLNFNWVESMFKNRSSFWVENETHYILDERKLKGNFLFSQKIFFDKKTNHIKKYSDKVRCYKATELQEIIQTVLPLSKIISLTDGYSDKNFVDTTTPLGVFNIQVSG